LQIKLLITYSDYFLIEFVVMSKAKTASKNSKTNRGSGVAAYLGSIVITPARFVGLFVGLGNYIAVLNKATGELIVDQNGKPLHWHSCKKEYKKI
jgi:hypothetical protein